MKNRFENFVFKYDFRAPKMKDSCRIHLVPEFLTKCNIMLQFCKSTNSGKTIYLFCILFAFICLQNSSMHPVICLWMTTEVYESRADSLIWATECYTLATLFSAHSAFMVLNCLILKLLNKYKYSDNFK